jgi:hypothetical protein
MLILALLSVNAEVLFPRLCDMRVITGRTSKTEHYAAIYARDTTTPEICKNGIDFRMIAQGPNEIDRRTSVMKLLDDIEKRVAKEVMKVA